MPLLPVRCQRCGSLSVAGLLIPPSAISSGLFKASVEVETDPIKCPLCRAALTEKEQIASNELYNTIREARLSQREATDLLKIAIDLCKKGATHSEVMSSVQSEVPKAIGLMKFIPSSDVTGALALIIAILSLADDLVANWLIPHAGAIGRHLTADVGNRLPIQLSSVPIEAKDDERDIDLATVEGEWRGNASQSLYSLAFYQGKEVYFYNLYADRVSDKPGHFSFYICLNRFSEDSPEYHGMSPSDRREILKVYWLLYIARTDHWGHFFPHNISQGTWGAPKEIDGYQALAKADAVPFQVAWSTNSTLRIVSISYQDWLRNFRIALRNYNIHAKQTKRWLQRRGWS